MIPTPVIPPTDSITDWIGVTIAFIIMISTFATVLWRFGQVVDRNTFVIKQIDETIKAQWELIGQHQDKLANHGERIIKVETRLDYHEGEKP